MRLHEQSNLSRACTEFLKKNFYFKNNRALEYTLIGYEFILHIQQVYFLSNKLIESVILDCLANEISLVLEVLSQFD